MISLDIAMRQVRRLSVLGGAYNAMADEGLAEIALAVCGCRDEREASDLVSAVIDTPPMDAGVPRMPLPGTLKAMLATMRERTQTEAERLAAKCKSCAEGSGWVYVDGGVVRCPDCRPVAR